MTTKNKVYDVVVEFRRIETVTICVSADSKEEALKKARDFDYIDIDFDPYIGDDNVQYLWDEAEVLEA